MKKEIPFCSKQIGKPRALTPTIILSQGSVAINWRTVHGFVCLVCYCLGLLHYLFYLYSPPIVRFYLSKVSDRWRSRGAIFKLSPMIGLPSCLTAARPFRCENIWGAPLGPFLLFAPSLKVACDVLQDPERRVNLGSLHFWDYDRVEATDPYTACIWRDDARSVLAAWSFDVGAVQKVTLLLLIIALFILRRNKRFRDVEHEAWPVNDKLRGKHKPGARENRDTGQYGPAPEITHHPIRYTVPYNVQHEPGTEIPEKMLIYPTHSRTRKSLWEWSRGEARWLGPYGHHSVSSPRSSNRTCGFPASGFPTGFTSKHTAGGQDGPDVVGSHRAPRTRPYRGNLVPRDDTLWRLTRKMTYSLVDRVVDGPVSRHSRSHGRSRATNRAACCSVDRAPRARGRGCRDRAPRGPSP